MSADRLSAGKGEPIDILILGPMDSKGEDVIPRTERLEKVVSHIVKKINLNGSFSVKSPESLSGGVIIPGILELIESAELVIIDLAKNSPSVAYEVAVVQALGVPNILVTDENSPPFYFSTKQYIGGFKIERERNFGTPENVNPKFYNDLENQIKTFLEALLVIRNPSAKKDSYDKALRIIDPYTDNELSRYFHGLPIVDIAGPSSLASGYYVNALSRFVRDDGFFSEEEKVSLNSVVASKKGLPATKSAISKFVIVFPPERMENYQADNKKFIGELAKHGFRVEQRIIQDTKKVMRPYTGNFLAKSDGNLLDPAVVIEIPTTLYALQNVPRIWRLVELKVESEERRKSLTGRRIDGMFSSFEATIKLLMRRNNISDEIQNQVEFIRFHQLSEQLKRLSTLGKIRRGRKN